MEPAEDASLEPAIQWLAQTILASPLIHEQAPWVRESGLAEEMEGLKSEVKSVQLVVSAVKGRALGNKPLAESLVELKEVLYDADDAVDELDYCRLLQLDQKDDLDQTDGHHGASQADRSIENDVDELHLLMQLDQGDDLDQTDGHHGASQADRSTENAVDELHLLMQLDQGDDLDQTDGHHGASQADRSTENAVDELHLLLQLDQGGTRHDPDQTDGHHGTSQADRSTENAHVPSTSGTLPDPHATDGHETQLVEISGADAAVQSSSVGKLRSKLWKEFEIVKSNKKGAPVRAKCIHCQTELACPTKQGTGVLQNHLKSKACLNKKREGNDPLSTADATTNPMPLATGNLSSKKRRRHDPDQMDGHHGASQADRLIENGNAPGTLPDLHETNGHGTQAVERSRENAAAQSSSMGKLRSNVCKEFEIIEFEQNGAPVREKGKHCGTELGCPTNRGTGVLHNHLNSKACPYDPLSTADASKNPVPVATGNLSSKKKRRDEELTCPRTTNTNRWNINDFSKMISDITLTLHRIQEGVIRVLSILGSDFAANSNHSQGATSHQHRRTSGTLQGRVYGRDFEKNTIIELMKKEKSATGVTVLPILGIAGVGKTAVAQLVYNHPAVKNQFNHMVWIWVSNSFDAIELTKYMLGSVSKETDVGLCNFAKLQEILESYIKSKRILLILDDVWDGINDYQWNQLLAPFNSDSARGNMIIVTTRKPCVAKRRGTVRPITLGALNNDDFWLFFGACAFGDANHEEQESLSNIGQQIAQKLKGNPLAAETAGALLSEHRTVGHWSSILKNEDWKSMKLSGGIMSALKLCYDQLPYHLQQCFSYCSLFPCNYEFLAEEVVRIWISVGFVKCNNSSKRLEEIGRDYLSDLVNLGFFEQLKKKSSSGCTHICYVMYNLMHDFARVVSRTECATIDGLQCNRMFPTVRHLSIISNSVWNRAHSEKFEEILRNTVTSVGKLRSLVFIGPYRTSFFKFLQTAFQKACNLRLLHFSATCTDCYSFMDNSFLCNSVNPAHLRYLKLDYGHYEEGTFSQVVSKSFHLQVLDVECKFKNHYWLFQKDSEPQVFPSLERLRFLTRLKLSNMQNVREVFVPSLEELVLFKMPKLKTCSCTSATCLKSILRVLEIQMCPALEVFDLFQKVYNSEAEHNSCLPSLKKLTIYDCPDLHVLIPLPPSATVSKIKGSSSQTLRIKPNSVLGESPYEMTLDDKFLSFHNMRDLEYLQIKDCCNLVSISQRAFGHLISLKSLKIKNCKKLLFSDEDLIPSNDGALSSLESLRIESCGITGKWLSLMLWHSPTLKKLYLDDCPQLTQLQIEEDKNIQSNLASASEASSSGYNSLTSSAADRLCCTPLNVTSLKEITILNCPHLIFDGNRKGFAGFTSLEKLSISVCLELLSSLVHNDGQAKGRWPLPHSLEELSICGYSHETLRPCFVGNLTRLKKLEVTCSPCLKSLQLDSCTMMEYLRICECNSLNILEGLKSLVNLRELIVVNSPVLASLATPAKVCKQFEPIVSDSRESLFLHNEVSQLAGLESLHISELSLLTSSFCEGLISLESLSLQYLQEPRLTDEQERALLLLGSLQELQFISSWVLLDLPARLHSLPYLKTLKINDCKGISGLPNEGLPPTLKELEIESCSYELSAQCRSLATSRLMVKIDGHYV